MLERVGRFTITRKIGEGGMGVVYAAHDPRLDRPVAIKMVRDEASSEIDRQRLWREARAAARVSHPNICQLYEIGEEGGVHFIAMELLEGETLADRIAHGPLPVDEAVQITSVILSALEILHAQGFLHRDLKPTNIFLTQVGVKILDFGLARPMAGLGEPGDMAITQAGILMGTPRYLAPEVWRQEELGPPADLFAVGALLYEMLAGRPAFPGDTMLQVHEAIMTLEPPMLGGSAAAAALDRVIHRALRKRPAERFPSATAMAAALMDARGMEDSQERVAPHRLMRFIALPFRVLRPDPDTDFLAFSLPDAVTSSLSGLGSLVVRSTATAGRFAKDDLRLEEIAKQADVDVVLSGTLLRVGEQLRVTAQLLEAPAGTLLWSQTFQTDTRDLFELQDTLTKRIVESLAVPLVARDRAALRRDAPASAQAYEFYLRANQLAYDAKRWELARDLYRQSLDLDPGYAPAWARLGRLYRVMSIYDTRAHEKYSAQAQEAFKRAIEINPDLSLAHNLYTYVEIDMGRALDAIQRLLDRARVNMNDAELFAGLTQACRYCGLLDASLAAYERARRIDPGIRTSVAHAYLMHGDYDLAIEADLDDPPFVTPLALELSGRRDEAIALLRRLDSASVPPLLHDILAGLRALMEGRLDESAPIMERLLARWQSNDPCGLYYLTRAVARSGLTDRALQQLPVVVDGGFYCHPFMMRDPWLDSLRGRPEFERIMHRAEERYREAQRAFSDCGGERILGL